MLKLGARSRNSRSLASAAAMVASCSALKRAISSAVLFMSS